SDSSDESVGSPPSRVILFGDIPTVIPFISMVDPETSTTAPVISSAAFMIEMTIVASPTGLCGLVPYSDFDSDSPDEMIPQSTLSRYQLLHHSYTPILLRLLILLMDHHRRTLMLLSLLVGGAGVMTARKRVGPLPARRLTWRHVSPRFSDHRPSSSSLPTDFSPVHSSSLDAPDQTHSRSSTRVVSPRLCYPPVRAPQHSEAFRRWCASLLSIFYPPTTSKLSSGDSSERPLHLSLHSTGPSHKRCRSLANFVPSSTPVTASLSLTRANLLPPRKRDHIEVDPKDNREDFKASVGDTVVLGIDPRSVPMVDEEIIEPVRGDSFSSSGTRDGTVRIVRIKTTQR
nr:hypothetical protein [Tanacetum cinerariifolium]